MKNPSSVSLILRRKSIYGVRKVCVERWRLLDSLSPLVDVQHPAVHMRQENVIVENSEAVKLVRNKILKLSLHRSTIRAPNSPQQTPENVDYDRVEGSAHAARLYPLEPLVELGKVSRYARAGVACVVPLALCVPNSKNTHTTMY